VRGLEEIRSEDRRRAKAAIARLNRRHPTRRQLVDLTEHLPIEQLDRVLRAIATVVNGAESLALDDALDRGELIERLRCALGAVPDRGVKIRRPHAGPECNCERCR
jgi:hypothetical protein